AMARSFREAGFQWATQFAYDPTALAYANTEYQTHYLNLLYTPSKAISLLIASKAFHKLPRLKSFGSYPADSSFDVFRVSYKNSLSEMNTAEEFYYSNNTDTKPVDPSKLEHIAGVGSSAVIQYEGSGAYFLDKIARGVWRLEVMPDAILIRDPFERASPKKEVARLEWRGNSMHIHLPDLMSFSIMGINDGNKFSATASGSFQIEPGTYLLKENNVPVPNIDLATMKEFAGTKPLFTEPFLRHEPFKEVSAGKSFTVVATIVGLDSGKATLQINKPGGSFGSTREIPMVRRLSNYSAEVPTDFVSTGLLTYRIILQKANEFTVFPNNHTGNPNAWDNLDNDNWKTFVVSDKAKLEIFNSTIDQSIRTYPVFSRGFQTSYPTGIEPGQLILRLSATGVSPKHPIGFACYVADKMKGRQAELDSFEKLVIRVRNIESEPVKAKITLVNKDAFAFSSFITLTNSFRDIELPLDKLLADSLMLLPRPYPEFMPLWFKAQGSSSFKLSDIEQIQLTVGSDFTVDEVKKPCTIEVSSIWLEKKK
ncbi:MAG: membrane or secreted protein, partial [Flavisolibacter sp.]